MTGFIHSIIARHTAVESNVRPRFRSRFEPVKVSSPSIGAEGLAAIDQGAEPLERPKMASIDDLNKSSRNLLDEPRPLSWPSLNYNQYDSEAGGTSSQTTLSSQQEGVDSSHRLPISRKDGQIEKTSIGQSPTTMAQSTPPNNTKKVQSRINKEQRASNSNLKKNQVLSPSHSGGASGKNKEGQNRQEVLKATRKQGQAKKTTTNLQGGVSASKPLPRVTLPLQRPSQAPTVKVHIGRIDVRASIKVPPPKKQLHSPLPKMSLEDYLNNRKDKLK